MPSVLRGALGAAMLRESTNANNWKGGHGMANCIGAAAKAMARRNRREGGFNTIHPSAAAAARSVLCANTWCGGQNSCKPATACS